MKRLSICLAIALASSHTLAAELDCEVDKNTDMYFCFNPKKVNADGEARSFELYTGGPLKVTSTGYTATFYCTLGFMEMRDRRGVVFARDQPGKSHIIRLRESVCAATPIKKAKSK
jgi:hypothetical protein